MKRLLSIVTALLFTVVPLAGCGADDASLGVIGGADGPTSLILTNPEGNAASSDSDFPDFPNLPDLSEFGPAVTGVEALSLGDTVLDEEGWYASKEEVALYLMQYEALPGNYMTKKEAQALGWEGGSLEPYAPGMSIGGDRFGNYEGSLPDDRTYTECDIDTQGAQSRGAKRIVFSDDGLIFYTEDHYETFTLLTKGE